MQISRRSLIIGASFAASLVGGANKPAASSVTKSLPRIALNTKSEIERFQSSLAPGSVTVITGQSDTNWTSLLARICLVFKRQRMTPEGVTGKGAFLFAKASTESEIIEAMGIDPSSPICFYQSGWPRVWYAVCCSKTEPDYGHQEPIRFSEDGPGNIAEIILDIAYFRRLHSFQVVVIDDLNSIVAMPWMKQVPSATAARAQIQQLVEVSRITNVPIILTVRIFEPSLADALAQEPNVRIFECDTGTVAS